jgi:CYTH domain-containing protein
MTIDSTEIERKFLVDELPPAMDRGEPIVQGYVSAEGETEVRLRRKGKRYFETIKSGVGLTRHELEVELTQEQFDTLWSATEGRRVEKTRHTMEHGAVMLELDIYHGHLQGLITVEAEFPSVAAAEAFTPPDWFGTELTDDLRYSNRNLALNGLP